MDRLTFSVALSPPAPCPSGNLASTGYSPPHAGSQIGSIQESPPGRKIIDIVALEAQSMDQPDAEEQLKCMVQRLLNKAGSELWGDHS